MSTSKVIIKKNVTKLVVNEKAKFQYVSLYTNSYSEGKRSFQLMGHDLPVPCRGYSPLFLPDSNFYTYSTVIFDSERWESDHEKNLKTQAGFFGKIKVNARKDVTDIVNEYQNLIEKEVMAVINGEHVEMKETMDSDPKIKEHMKKFIQLFKPAGKTFNDTERFDRFTPCHYTSKEGNTVYQFYVRENTKFFIDEKEVDRKYMYMKSFNAKLYLDSPSIHFIVKDGKFEKIVTKIPIVKVDVFPHEIKGDPNLVYEMSKITISE